MRRPQERAARVSRCHQLAAFRAATRCLDTHRSRDATSLACYVLTMRRTLLVILISFLAACSNSSGSSPSQAAPQTVAKPSKDPVTAKQLISSGATVIDVRTADEFAGGHVRGAVNIPVAELGQRMDEVAGLVKADKTAPIVVYCASGRRSSQAQEALSAAGYSRIVNGGGFDDLQ